MAAKQVRFHDELEFQSSWTLYSDINWQNRQKMYTVKTIRDFWMLYNAFPKLEDITYRTNLSFMKKDIAPVWESDENNNGGKWCINLKDDKDRINEIWLHILLGLVGETIDPVMDEIVGMIIHLRRNGDRLDVWTRGTKKEIQMKIGRCLKSITKCTDITFTAHKDALKNQSHYETPPMYSV
jgi:hypothetical protein